MESASQPRFWLKELLVLNKQEGGRSEQDMTKSSGIRLLSES
jgi:hypothetical protein